MIGRLLFPPFILCLWILFFILLCSLGFLFFALAPLSPDISVQPFTPKVSPEFTGYLSKNELLSSAEKLFENKIIGPESIAIGKDEIYSGLSDRQIVRLNPDTGEVNLIVKVGGKDCDGKIPCSYPAGVRFGSEGYLYVADGYKGIYKVNITTGEIIILVDGSKPVNGKKVDFFNDLVISKTGDVYFTEFGLPSLEDLILYSIEHAPRGRIHHYNPATKKTTVLLDQVFQANGIELTPEEDALIIAQSYECNIIKLFIKGPKKGQVQMFSDNLPGYPDNIRRTNRNTYWVAFFMAKYPGQTLIHELLGPYPLFRKVFYQSLVHSSRLLKSLETIKGIGTIFGIMEQCLTSFIDNTVFDWTYGLVVELDQQGQIIRSLHSPDGSRNKFSQAIEHKNHLYLGTPWNTYVGRLKL